MRTRPDWTPFVAVIGLGTLAVLAVLGKSAVMLVSVLAMAVAFGATRSASLGRRLGAVAVAGLGASLLAEAVHTAYHALGFAPGGDTGGFWVSAVLVGLINVAAFGGLLLVTEWLARRTAGD